MHGYHDRLALVDLTARRVDYAPLRESEVRALLGGASLGAAHLARLTGPETDPLGPGNPLIFMTGPFTATRIPSGSRHEVVSLSPLTGIYAESSCGGEFGWDLKRQGLDGLIVTGASETPVALVVAEGGVRFREAGDLWGLDVFQADDKLKAELGKVVTALIGPAGERLVRLACISHNGRETRTAGRCGLGAVMGAKKLKGIVVASGGGREASLFDPEGLKESVRAALPRLRERLEIFGQIGTPGGVINYDRLGNLPINNWRDARGTAIASKITGTVLKETIAVGRSGCKGCPVVCGRIVEVKDGPFATDGRVEGPEYETVAAFGTLNLNDDLASIAKANELCNRLGLDTISTGAVIAFASECLEKGLLKNSDLDGLDLGFGKPFGLVEMVRRMAFQEGSLAAALGQGSRRAAQIIGGNAVEYTVEVKGLELPMHDPRFSWGHAISYPTGPRGACHLSSLAHPFELSVAAPELGYSEPFPGRERPGKAEWTMKLQDAMNILDSLVMCKFSMLNNALNLTDFRAWLNQVTGLGLSLEEFLAVGERAFTLKRLINNRRGVSRKDDDLPPRMRTLKKQGQDVNFDVPPLYPLLSDYYDRRGWTEEGRPTPETVARLGLVNWEAGI